MLTVYLNQNDIPNDHKYIDKNDYFFEFNTNITELDNLDCAKELIKKIDQSDYLGGGKLISKFTNKLVENIEYHSIEYLSSGCKTLLNILLHPEIVFNTIECGYNVIDEIIKLDKGKIYMPLHPIVDIEKPILVIKDGIETIIDNTDSFYELLEDTE